MKQLMKRNQAEADGSKKAYSDGSMVRLRDDLEKSCDGLYTLHNKRVSEGITSGT